MFARRCARLATSRTAVPLTSFLARARYSTGPSYEHILVSTPKPGVGMSEQPLHTNFTKGKVPNSSISYPQPTQGPECALQPSSRRTE